MTSLKQLARAATVAWCPLDKHKTLLASGTIAGTIDDSFATNSSLELYGLSLDDPEPDMKFLGSIMAKDCFHKVAWGIKGSSDARGSLSYGLIAGGMSDGAVNFWNPSNIINGENAAPLARVEQHKGLVLGLEFHPKEQNLLASGSSDSEIYIWDIAAPGAPKVSRPHNKGSALNAGITCLGWNKRVPHILASASEVGETNVWDLRQKRAILTFRPEGHQQIRATSLAWNPAASVEIAVSYANTTIEVWDLRTHMSPKTRLSQGHEGMVMCLAWNPHDPNVLMSSGQDGRIVAWNPHSGELLDSINSEGAQSSFEMQWSPFIPSIMSTCTYDGRVVIRSVQKTGNYVPLWHQRPVGASFAFGGKLVTFGEGVPAGLSPTSAAAAAAAPPPPAATQLKITQLVTEPAVLQRAEQFQNAIDRQDYEGFCNEKINHAASEEERNTWSFMRILFENDASQRSKMLQYLGYEAPKPASESKQVEGAPDAAAAPKEESEPKKQAKKASLGGDDFFDTFGAEGEEGLDLDVEPKKPAPAKTEPKPASAAAGGLAPEDDVDKAVHKALVVGDFDSAVSRCLAAGRMADAIMLASCGGPELWKRTQDAYFSGHKQGFIKNVVSAVVKRDLKPLVSSSDLKHWRETLAILITYTVGKEYRDLATTLAERLDREAHDAASAISVYMCSSNVEQAANIWTRGLKKSSSAPLLALQDTLEKVVVFAHATRQAAAGSPLLSAKYCEYASLLVSQGRLSSALKYLVAASGSSGADDLLSASLKERIYNGLSDPRERQQFPPPPLPFKPVQVFGSAPSQQAQRQPQKPIGQPAAGGWPQQPQQPQQQTQQPPHGAAPFGGPVPPAFGRPAPGPVPPTNPAGPGPHMGAAPAHLSNGLPGARPGFPGAPTNAASGFPGAPGGPTAAHAHHLPSTLPQTGPLPQRGTAAAPMMPGQPPQQMPQHLQPPSQPQMQHQQPPPRPGMPGFPPAAGPAPVPGGFAGPGQLPPQQPAQQQPPPRGPVALPQQQQPPRGPAQPPMPGQPIPAPQPGPGMGGPLGMPNQPQAAAAQPGARAPPAMPPMPGMPPAGRFAGAPATAGQPPTGGMSAQPQAGFPPGPGQQPMPQQPAGILGVRPVPPIPAAAPAGLPAQPPASRQGMPNTLPPGPGAPMAPAGQGMPLRNPMSPSANGVPPSGHPQQTAGPAGMGMPPPRGFAPQNGAPAGMSGAPPTNVPPQPQSGLMPRAGPSQPPMPSNGAMAQPYAPMPARAPQNSAPGPMSPETRPPVPAAQGFNPYASGSPAPSHHSSGSTGGPVLSSSPPTLKPNANAPPAAQVAADAKLIKESFDGVVARLNASDVDKRKLQDVQKRLEDLYKKLDGNELSAGAVDKLNRMAAAVNVQDYESVKKLHQALVTDEWAGNNVWLMGLKTLLGVLAK